MPVPFWLSAAVPTGMLALRGPPLGAVVLPAVHPAAAVGSRAMTGTAGTRPTAVAVAVAVVDVGAGTVVPVLPASELVPGTPDVHEIPGRLRNLHK